MADFESIANETVTTLQDIDQVASETGTQISSTVQTLIEKEREYRQLTTDLTTKLSSLETRVSEAKTNNFVRADALNTKLSELEMRATAVRDKIKQELATREQKIKDYDGEAAKFEDEAKVQAEDVIGDVDIARDVLEDCNSAMLASFDQIEKRAEDSTNQLQSMIDEINLQGSNAAKFVEDRLAAEIKEHAAAASTRLSELYDEWADKINTLQESNDYGGHADSNYTTQVVGGLSGVEDVNETVTEALDKQKIVDVGEKALKAIAELNTQMKKSEEVYGEVDKKLEQTAEVLSEVAK